MLFLAWVVFGPRAAPYAAGMLPTATALPMAAAGGASPKARILVTLNFWYWAELSQDSTIFTFLTSHVVSRRQRFHGPDCHTNNNIVVGNMIPSLLPDGWGNKNMAYTGGGFGHYYGS